MPNAPEFNQHQQDPDSFLMGGGVPSASFTKIGDMCSGVVSEKPVLRQQTDLNTGLPKTWENGDPMMQLVVTLQTDERDPAIEDDDGRRRLYVKFNMRSAVADAVRKAKAKSLEVGGKLTVIYRSDGEVTKRGFNPPKLYQATYVPPTTNFLEDDRHAGPSQVAVNPIHADTTAIWTLADAIGHAEDAGLTKDEFLGLLRNAGLKGYTASRDTTIARNVIAAAVEAKQKSAAAVEEEQIPF